MNDNHTPQKVYDQYKDGESFNTSIGLAEKVEENENFFLGRQWEGVESNGLPTPVFNFVETIIGHLVASLVTDNIKIQASSMDVSGKYSPADIDRACDVLNAQFERLVETEKLTSKIRKAMRMAAVDGDACFYCYFDPYIETGQTVPGDITFEIVENTRVFFGNPFTPDVSKQPYIIIMRRENVEDVQRRAKIHKGEPDKIKPDKDEATESDTKPDDNRVTVFLKFWREYDEDGAVKTVKAYECTSNAVVRKEWDLKIKRYPITWMNWTFVLNSYHGEAAATSLVNNQDFVNRLFAMTMISLMTTAYPKVVYDKTRIAKWDNRVGSAIGVNGGDVANVARIMDPATISPQVSQFMDAAIKYTKDFKGANDAALGNVRPDNTSAIVAIQRAAAMPMEITKQDNYQFIEDWARILVDMMGSYYGVRYVDGKDENGNRAVVPYDFAILKDMPIAIKLDVGAASYWTEMIGVQTMDNLLINKMITPPDYLERLPRGWIPKQQELVDKTRIAQAKQETAQEMADAVPMPPMPDQQPIPTGRGNHSLQRSIANQA